MGPRRQNEKPKDFNKSIKNLFLYLKPYYVSLIISIVLALVGSVFSIIGPDKIKEITNLIVSNLTTGIDLNKIKNISLILIIIYLVGAICTYIEHFIMSTITNKFIK